MGQGLFYTGREGLIQENQMPPPCAVPQPPAVLTRILGELGDLDAIAPTYAEDEATVMIQV